MTDELKFGMDKAPSLLKWLTDLDNNPKSHTETWCDGWNAATNNLSQENANLTAKLKLAVEALEAIRDASTWAKSWDHPSHLNDKARVALAKIGEQR